LFSRPDGRDGDFVSNFHIPSDPEARAAFLDMTRELVEYRLARYRNRQRDRYDESEQQTGAFRAKLITNKRDPVLELPSRDTHPDIPVGETTVALPDGQKWRFRFVTDAVKAARPVGDDKNRLSDLLRGWFGPAAGEPGTEFSVEFRPSKQSWRVEPLGEHVIPFARPGHIIAFPDLQAAAGAHRLPQGDTPGAIQLRIGDSGAPPADFAVQAVGDSMNGGGAGIRQGIRDGDWALMRWARGEPLGGVVGRVALVRHEAADSDGPAYYLKRVAETDDGFELRSDNPQMLAMPASADTVVVALHVDTLRSDEVATEQVTALVEALRAELERRAPAESSAYGAAFTEGVRRVHDHASGRNALAIDLAEWLVAAYEIDSALSRSIVERVLASS
jgi:hypothetical protein